MNGRNLSLHVTDAFDETLDDLARQTGLTKGEVIREAVILLNESHKAIRDGAHLGVADDVSRLDEEFVLSSRRSAAL